MPTAIEGKKILVTGGTGSIGSTIVRRLLDLGAAQVRVFSRDDSKQFHMRTRLANDERLRFLIGDIRDPERLDRAMRQVQIVFHAAAIKHVIASEQNPFEAIKTNILGTQNVITTALAHGVEKVIGISTDKASDPTNVLGCTKLLAEKLFTSTYHYKGDLQTRFSTVRFGNVIGSRGSVIPLFCSQIRDGKPITITDPEMLRFFMSIEDAVNLVFRASEHMLDREVFVLKMPIVKIGDLARATIRVFAPRFGKVAEEVSIKYIGRQVGERTHEKLLASDEAEGALETDEMFITKPMVDPIWDQGLSPEDYPGSRKTDVRDYSTASLARFGLLSEDQICELLERSRPDIERGMWS